MRQKEMGFAQKRISILRTSINVKAGRVISQCNCGCIFIRFRSNEIVQPFPDAPPYNTVERDYFKRLLQDDERASVF